VVCVGDNAGAKHDEGANANGSGEEIDLRHDSFPACRFDRPTFFAIERAREAYVAQRRWRAQDGGPFARVTRNADQLSLTRTTPAAIQARHAAMTSVQNSKSSWLMPNNLRLM
jgi:hypothetical protein